MYSWVRRFPFLYLTLCICKVKLCAGSAIFIFFTLENGLQKDKQEVGERSQGGRTVSALPTSTHTSQQRIATLISGTFIGALSKLWEKRILLLKRKKMIGNCWAKWSLTVSFSSLRLWLLTNTSHYAYQFSHIRCWGIKLLKDFA